MNQPKLGVIAGAGDLPQLLVQACQESGRPYHVIALEGFAGPWVENHPHTEAGIGSVGKIFKNLHAHDCGEVVMAGRVQRPDFSRLGLDLTGARLLPKILAAGRKGDDGLLSGVVRLLEDEGFRVVGADDVVADLLIPEGDFGAHSPQEQDLADIRRAVDVVRAMGALDIGQGAVVCRELVLAVEAAEGTDAMLARCADLPAAVRGAPDARAGVLVKLPKPRQERRVDLPAIGVSTVTRCAEAGLAGIAVPAGGALIVARDDVRGQADKFGLFVRGLRPNEAN